MKTLSLIKLIGGAITLSSLAMAQAHADTVHTTKVACYASVQTQCYGNGQNNCTSGEYQEGLGWCDQYYPSASSQGASTQIQANAQRMPKFGKTR